MKEEIIIMQIDNRINHLKRIINNYCQTPIVEWSKEDTEKRKRSRCKIENEITKLQNKKKLILDINLN